MPHLKRSEKSAPPASAHRVGTAALELVIVLPLLLVIAAGATDLARAIHYENALANAARVGAAYGAVHSFTTYTRSTWESRVRAAATQEAANLPHFDGRHLQLSVTVTTVTGGARLIRVDAAYPFEPIFDWPGVADRVLLRQSVAMQAYR